MESDTYYDILGLPPDASHRQVVNAFAQLAERYHPRLTSDPSARQRFEEAKTAYETLTDYDKRLRYNIERGLPDPPRPGKTAEGGGLLAEVGSLVPDSWPVLLPVLLLLFLRFAAYYAIDTWYALGSPLWGR